MVADEVDYVIGVDTHRDAHMLAAVTAPAGAVVAGETVSADVRGYRAALRFGARFAAGRRVWAIEGSGSYGAGLRRYLVERGGTVLELSRAPKGERRLRGKDDTLDAVRTARAALASQTLTLPRARERREALRLLLLRAPKRRRRAARGAQPAASRDRHRARPASPGASRTPGREAARPLSSAASDAHGDG